MELSDNQRLYLQTIFDYFHTKGTWPTRRYLEGVFFEKNPAFDIDEIVKSFPSDFVEISSSSGSIYSGGPVLTVPAMYLCQGAEEDLKDFIQVVRFCIDKYLKFDEEPKITSDDLSRELNLSPLSARKAMQLLPFEPRIFGSVTSGSNQATYFGIAKEILRFQGVETIEQYLEKRDQSKKASASPMMSSDTLRPLIGHMYSKAIHPDKKDIEAGITRWEQDLTKPAEGDGGKLEVGLLNALTRLGIPTFFSGRGNQGGVEKYAYDLIALGLFARRSPTVILISCKSSYKQPNLGEVGKLCDAVEQVKELLGPDWSVFGALSVLGNPSLGIFTNQHDYRLWKKAHLQAILHAHTAESLDHMLWIHPRNWHPDSEKMWRSIYSSFHKDLPEEILKEIMAP